MTSVTDLEKHVGILLSHYVKLLRSLLRMLAQPGAPGAPLSHRAMRSDNARATPAVVRSVAVYRIAGRGRYVPATTPMV